MKPLRLCFLFLVIIFCQVTIMAQTTVAGKVVDDTGEGLIGANIIVKGTRFFRCDAEKKPSTRGIGASYI